MLALYLASFILGGGLVALSAFLGDGDAHDGDAGHGDGDADHGESNDTDAGAGPWIPFLSIRFWTFTLAFFGLMGLATHLLTSVPAFIELGASLAVGVTAGLGVSWTVRRLQLSSSDSTVRPDELLGREAQILLPISRERPGKVRLLVGGRQLDLIATTEETDALGVSEPVTVIELDGTGVRVVRSTALLPSVAGGEP